MLVHDAGELHPVPAIAREIRRHLDRYGVSLRSETTVTAVAGGNALMLHGPAGPERLPADLIHLHPPYAAPDFIAASGLDADGTNGFIAVIRPPFGIAPSDASGQSEMLAISAMPAPAARCDIR